MRVIQVQLKGSGATIYNAIDIKGVLEEIKELITEKDIGQEITISQKEMSQEDFLKLKEFSGY